MPAGSFGAAANHGSSVGTGPGHLAPAKAFLGYPATSPLAITAIPRVRLAATIDQMQSSLEVPARLVSFDDGDEGALSSVAVISARCQALDDIIGQVPEFVFAIVLQILCDGVVEKLARDLVPVGLARGLDALAVLALVFPLPRKAFCPSLVPSRHTGFLSTSSTEAASFVRAEPANAVCMNRKSRTRHR